MFHKDFHDFHQLKNNSTIQNQKFSHLFNHPIKYSPSLSLNALFFTHEDNLLLNKFTKITSLFENQSYRYFSRNRINFHFLKTP